MNRLIWCMSKLPSKSWLSLFQQPWLLSVSFMTISCFHWVFLTQAVVLVAK